MKSLLKVINVTKKFNNNEIVLKGINLEIYENSFVVILGPSGSGKSTLLNVMSGLLKTTSGEIRYNDNDLENMSEKEMASWRRNEISNIFQNYLLLPDLTVEENIAIGLPDTGKGLELAKISELLGIHELMNKFPAQLSGGQQQRTAIARAVIKNPKILFCDEATGALDEENSKYVLRLLREIHKEYGTTVIFITHNLKIADTAERIIVLKDGMVVKDRTNDQPLSVEEINWGV